MTSLPSGEFSSSFTNSIQRTQPHQTSERTMLQTPGRIRIQRGAADGLPGTGEDRPIRADLVRQIKAQIMAGEYDSPAKIEAAADRLAGALDLLA